MAPSAMEIPEISPGILDKKMGKFDLNNMDRMSEMDIHGLAVSSGDIMDSSSFRATSGSKKGYFRASSPTGSMRSTYTTRHMSSRIMSGGLTHWGNPEYSSELTQQGEVEFKALASLMATISNHSSTLREVWTKVIAERDGYASAWALMREQVDHLEEQIGKRDVEIKKFTSQLGEKEKENKKLKDDFNASNALIIELRGQLATRDLDNNNIRRELNTANGQNVRLRAELEETKAALKRAELNLVAATEELQVSKETADRYRRDLNSMSNEFIVLQGNNAELKEKYEAAQMKLQLAAQREEKLTAKAHETLHEISVMESTIETLRTRIGQFEEQVDEMSESNEKTLVELEVLKTSTSTHKEDMEKSLRKVADLKRRLDESKKAADDAKETAKEWKLKCKHYENEYTSIEKHTNQLQDEQVRLQAILAEINQKLRQANKEKQLMADKYETESKRSQEHQRKLVVLQDSMNRMETSHTEKTGEISSLTERLTLVESERDEVLRKFGDLKSFTEKLQSSINSLKAEMSAVTERSESASERLRESETRYEEIHDSMIAVQESYNILESDHETLRKMLLDAREQKEKAIEARDAADKERDDAIERYEAKCRELERYQESVTSHSHSNGKSEVRRTVSKSQHKKGGKHVHVTDGASA